MTFARTMADLWGMANWTVFAWFALDMVRDLTSGMGVLQCRRPSRYLATRFRRKMVGWWSNCL